MSGSRRRFLKSSCMAGLGLAMSSAATARSSPETDPKKIRLLVTADIHAQLFTHDEYFRENDRDVYRQRGGLDVLKTMVDRLRKEAPDSLLIDAGDFFHGHAIASWTNGKDLIPYLNAFSYDILVPGNWEVVYRKAAMLEDLGSANARKICANMWHDQPGPPQTIFPPWTIRTVAGTRIGFIGYTDHLVPRRQPPALSAGIRYNHALESVAGHIRHLREQESCTVIILITHIGLAQQIRMANDPAVEGADLIIGADTHERVRTPIQGRYAPVVECGAFGSFLGCIDLNIRNQRLNKINYELLDVDPEKYRPDASITRMLRRTRTPHKEKLDEVLGHTTAPLVRYFVLETPMDNLITDAIRWKTGTDIALSNGFRFCQPLVGTPEKPAAITREFLWNMLPVDSPARLAKVSGRQILDWLEKELENAFSEDARRRFGGWFVRFSGMNVLLTVGAPAGKRVKEVRIGNALLETERIYTIAACEREGDPVDTLCRIEKVMEPNTVGYSIHNILEEYLSNNPSVSPHLEGRAVATDQPATLLTQVQGTTYEFR